jgi:murein L,D-transpeptidase YcbB/YkuD
VIVGRPYRRTPMFSSRITHLIVNPDWTVPINIARQDILPKLQQDPEYLAREGFDVFDGWSPEAPQVDPSAIEWSAMRPASFTYKLRQQPGPLNALGQIKFMLPNRYNVYLHDTPHRELFQRTERTFSSGCVRLGDPIALALYLMRNMPGWDRAHLDQLIDGGRTQRVNLPAAVPVYFTYFTAWVDDQDMLHFRPDIYERDAQLYTALQDQLVARRIELDLAS